MKFENPVAVITGDIVSSSSLSEEERTIFREKVKGLNIDSILLKPEFYRGDSFQLASHLSFSLLIALKIRTEMKCIKALNDVRISIGIGKISEWEESILMANGSAFERSGKNLDKLKKTSLNLLIVTGNKDLDDELKTYCELVDPYLKNLTSNQANIVGLKINDAIKNQLEGRKQKNQISGTTFITPSVTTTTTSQAEISDRLNISQPAISKSLKAANWKIINIFIQRYDQIINKYYATPE